MVVMSERKRANEAHGTLGSSIHKQRIVDNWTFRSPCRDGEHDPLVATVYLVRSSAGLRFRAEGKALGSGLEHGDIEVLRTMVEEQFRVQDLARRHLDWEDWIEVEISGFTLDKESAAALKIAYTIIKRGIDPQTGLAVTINRNNVIVPFPSAKKAGEPDPDGVDSNELSKWKMSRDQDLQYSYLPATPANIAAIESVVERLRELRARLNLVLDQDSIQRSLSCGLHLGITNQATASASPAEEMA